MRMTSATHPPAAPAVTNAAEEARVRSVVARAHRLRWPEFAFWALVAGAALALPGKALILNEIAILALFALSLDLVLGFAGIVSLGHAAFLGAGAYAAGLAAKFLTADPLLGLALAGMAAALLGFLTSFLVLRGTDLTRLMVTLGVALVLGELANREAWLTGGADGLQGIAMGPILGVFEFDLFGKTALAYSLGVLFLCFLAARRVVHSPFGLSLRAIRDNRLRAGAIGIPVNARLVALYTFAAAIAGIAGGLLAQTTQFVSLDVLDFTRSADALLVLVIGGAGTLYGGLVGAVIFKLLQDWLSTLSPHYWHFWIGAILVALVLVGRERAVGWVKARAARLLRSRPSDAGRPS